MATKHSSGGEDQMKTAELDWRLHAPMVFKVLTDSKYLKTRGVNFTMDEFRTIHQHGGWPYSPTKIRGFDEALSVLRDIGCTGSHFEAICILQGVSYHRLLVKGRELLARLFGGRYEVQT